jgi:hypothetical protein
MKKLTLILVLVVILAIYGFVSSVLGDLLAGDIQEWLGENYEGKEKQIRWGIAIFTFVAAAAVTVYFFLKGKKPGEEVKGRALIKDNSFQEAREGQRKAFLDRGNKKLAGRDFIDLEVSYTVEGSHDLAPLLNKGVEEGEKEQDLLKVFEGASGRLLMIGLPGSGKTTLLLQLAIALLDEYKEQIPVVLDIATWQPRFKTIEEWAVELLPDMGFNKNLAQQLIDEKKLLPLFDGLDELGEESRPGFLTAVEKYAAAKGSKFVITSRKAEYAATIDATVEYQVVVNPFTLAQIRKALQEKTSPERVAILNLIDEDEHFREAIKTPFYLNAVQLLFSHKNLSQKLAFKADDLEGRQGEIEAAFVEHTLGGLENYTKEDGQKWLAFLADRMKRRGLVRFELADMQYDWERFGRRGMILRSLLEGLVVGIAVGPAVSLFASLFLGLVLGPIRGLVKGLAFGLFGGMFIGLFGSMLIGLFIGLFKGPDIELKDKASWSLKAFFSFLRENLLLSLFLGLFLGLALGLSEGLFLGLVGGLVGGLFVSLLGALISMMNTAYNTYLKIDNPYQRFHGSMRSLHFSILQHWHLCYLLRKKDLLPRRYPDFLKAATEQNILESDGGSWRFRHRILQEYFVEVWEEELGDIEELADGYKSEN